MKNYIGVKIVQAELMNLGEYNKARGWITPHSEDPECPGYLIVYPDGYRSWSPKEIFESAYLFMGDDVSKISPEMVESFISASEALKLDAKTALLKVETLSGFVQYEVSSCVDPKNFDMELGTAICKERIKNTLWLCLGFVLQWGRFGLNKSK